MRIAILDDDENFAARVCTLMGENGHSSVHFQSSEDLIAELRRASFDLLLLDLSLPGMNGMEMLLWWKEHLKPAPPVIMVTARIDDSEIVAGLDAGADDYVTKPVVDTVLKSRVEAVLRRAYGKPSRIEKETYGNYVLDPADRTVTVDGRPVSTTAKEFALALLMFRNLERPLSRAYILHSVWGYDQKGCSRTLDAHISQIRNRLNLRPAHGLRLSSVYGFGYRMESVEAETQRDDLRGAPRHVSAPDAVAEGYVTPWKMASPPPQDPASLSRLLDARK